MKALRKFRKGLGAIRARLVPSLVSFRSASRKDGGITEAAENEPERFGHLIEMMDRPHGVSKAYRALRRAEDEKRVLGLVPVVGKCRTIIIDPPWPADADYLGRASPQYNLMTRSNTGIAGC